MALFVLDTNILVSALSTTSEVHWVIQGLLQEEFSMCISHDILLEYEEVLSRKYSVEVASDFLKALEELPNVQKVEIHFYWNLLTDPDDNKFVDAAVAGGASFIVSEDRHFRILDEIDFPKVQLMRLSDFQDWYLNLLPPAKS